MHSEGGWQIEFREGPLSGQTRYSVTEPEEEIQVPPHEGGPFTYVLAASVDPDEPNGLARRIYDPEPPLETRHQKRARFWRNRRMPAQRRVL